MKNQEWKNLLDNLPDSYNIFVEGQDYHGTIMHNKNNKIVYQEYGDIVFISPDYNDLIIPENCIEKIYTQDELKEVDEYPEETILMIEMKSGTTFQFMI